MTTMDPPPRPLYRRLFVDPEEYLDELLIQINDGRVIPIIGPELLQVEVNGTPVALYDHVARRLAEQLRLADQLPKDGYTLQDVAAAHTRAGGDIERVYTKIYGILKESTFTTPPALRKLARIDGIRLYVTTTFDSLLGQALSEAGRAPEQVVYAGSRARGDLPAGWATRAAPTVVHLMGQATSAPNYVVTEEDTLEFLTKLQADAPQMKLFEELTTKHLLILGCSFPDWLSRFFIRMAKGMQLSTRRPVGEWLADSRSQDDGSLALFLDNFSTNTRVFTVGALELIDQLSARWEERHPPENEETEEKKAEPRRTSADGEMPRGALLISYMREDQEAAERLRDGLQTVTDVWMDVQQLEAGDPWNLQIHRALAECDLFFPVISERAAQTHESYFRREWNAALKRLEGMSEERPFIMPVVIDGFDFKTPGVPPAFWNQQVAYLPGGQANPAFLAAVEKQVLKVRDPRGG